MITTYSDFFFYLVLHVAASISLLSSILFTYKSSYIPPFVLICIFSLNFLFLQLNCFPLEKNDIFSCPSDPLLTFKLSWEGKKYSKSHN